MGKTKLAIAREKAGKTQTQVAGEAKISVRLYQRYEYGTSVPNVRAALRIADALGVENLRELFGDERERGS